jgi:hypothetical protein
MKAVRAAAPGDNDDDERALSFGRVCCRSTLRFSSPLVRLLRGFVQVPKDSTSKYPNIVAGLAYLYGDAVSRTRGPGAFWTNSSQSLGSASSAVGRTLSQIYSAANSASTGYLFYNDELPTGPSSGSYGHTKGQLMWSATGGGRGFWLIHSVPKLAESPVNGGKSYSYPPTAIIYGQSFLCISLNLKGIDTAFVQMQYNNPQVYGKKWVASLAPVMPNANAFMTQNKVNKTPIRYEHRTQSNMTKMPPSSSSPCFGRGECQMTKIPPSSSPC